MIVEMQKKANIMMIERVVSFFEKLGFNVRVKPADEERGVFIAIHGEGANEVDFLHVTLSGIKNHARNDNFFTEHRNDFVPAEQFSADFDNKRALSQSAQ